jgi:hypothetical protein
MAFYAFAVLAASRIEGERVQVFVPENGFICINPPLVPGRVSSLSTKTRGCYTQWAGRLSKSKKADGRPT